VDRSPRVSGRRLLVWVRFRALLSFDSLSQVASSPSRCTGLSGRRLRSQPNGEPRFDRTLCNRHRPCCVGAVAIIRQLSCKPEQRTSDCRSLSIDESFLGEGYRTARGGTADRERGIRPGELPLRQGLSHQARAAIVLILSYELTRWDCPRPKAGDRPLLPSRDDEIDALTDQPEPEHQ
jgi:hypothetical protein